MNQEMKTKSEAKQYFKKLCSVLGDEYKLKYYETNFNDNSNDFIFSSEV